MKNQLVTACALMIAVSAASAQTRDYKENEDILKQIQEYNNTKKPSSPPSAEADEDKAKKKKTEVPANDSVLLKTGINMFNSGNYENAAKNFRQIIDDYPQSPYADTARIWIGRIHIKKYEYAKAIEELASVAETSGEYPAARYDTGFCLNAQGDSAAAISCYQTVAYSFPEHELADDALLQSGILFAKTGKGDEAIAAFLLLSSRYKDRETVDDALFCMGKVFESDPELRDIERAREIYRLFLKKSEEGLPHFKDSPLKNKAARELKRIEENHFRIKQ
ncbi:MAG: tetratricopeptide repeat protein [Spirochaetia bacterium]|nr:tetratricopeptide repeat protein [Spirochaetia bacterium]